MTYFGLPSNVYFDYVYPIVLQVSWSMLIVFFIFIARKVYIKSRRDKLEYLEYMAQLEQEGRLDEEYGESVN